MRVSRNNYSIVSPACLLTLFVSAYSTVSQAAYSEVAVITHPTVAVSATTAMNDASVVSASPTLPNAYELVRRLDAQQLETARLTGQVETLQQQVSQLTQRNADLQSLVASLPRPASATTADVTDATQQQLTNELLAVLQPLIQAQIADQVTQQVNRQVAQQVRLAAINPQGIQEGVQAGARRPFLTPATAVSANSAAGDSAQPQPQVAIADATPIGAQRPKLLTNLDIPANVAALDNVADAIPRQINPLTQASADPQAKQAYIAAYTALKREGAAAGIAQMQAFIDAYPNHSLTPNAHYWLGEFYLKATPPDVQAAQLEFKKVINDFNDYPSNDKQSQALYRLATFAKSQAQTAQARQYIERLLTNYPASNEAALAREVKW